METIKMQIECPYCKGTGVYVGMAEGRGAAVMCHRCDGTGAYEYSYSYNEYTGRKVKEGVSRVYLSSGGYKIGTGEINFDGIGEIDMDKEGISYLDFINGKKPEHIKKLLCPMQADQIACHNKEGFVDECNKLNGNRISMLTECKMQPEKGKCWERFENEIKNKKN